MFYFYSKYIFLVVEKLCIIFQVAVSDFFKSFEIQDTSRADWMFLKNYWYEGELSLSQLKLISIPIKYIILFHEWKKIQI